MRGGRSEREFAVLVLFLNHDGEECVLLTQRPATLSSYAGQVALPGGAREPDDAGLEETALRETEEEVGIPRQAIEVLAELPWQKTSREHRVKPFVGKTAWVAALKPNPCEVERVLFLPRKRLTPELFRVRGTWRDAKGKEYVVHTFRWEGLEVWGLTARILREVSNPWQSR